MGQSVTMEQGEASVAVTGEFDMSATFTVEPALERALDAPGLRAIELDLSGVTFIDSTGIGVVLWLNGETESRRLPLRIVPGPTEVQRVFETAGLADALPFAPA